MAGIQPWLFYPHSSSFSSPPLLQLSSPSSSRTTVLAAAARKNQKKSKSKTLDDSPEPTTIIINRGRKKQQQQVPDGQDDDDEDEDDDTTIPEVVTNRMMRRVGVSVGAPLALGVGFFPFFYYLKVVAKVDVPTWIPFGVSFLFFGAALLGVSYGIVSASWDPMREGSLLGWNEARRNWPVFRDSLWGRPGHGRRRNN